MHGTVVPTRSDREGAGGGQTAAQLLPRAADGAASASTAAPGGPEPSWGGTATAAHSNSGSRVRKKYLSL